MIERETERASSSAASPVQRDVYRETTVEVVGTPAATGAARDVYEKRVSEPGGEHSVHIEHISVPSAATRRGVGVTRAKQAISFIFGVINILLAIRFALLLLGANEVSGFVAFIYRLSRTLGGTSTRNAHTKVTSAISLCTKLTYDTLVSLNRTDEEDPMSQIEFETMIDKGAITVPSEYRSRIHGRVRVIIITDDIEDDMDMIEYLMQHPLHVNDATPLTRDEIYDRVK